MNIQRQISEMEGAHLIILDNDQMRVCPLNGRTEWKLGRYSSASEDRPDILFMSRVVSRRHGSFRYVQGQWYYVDDPQNLNGTFYNGKKIPRSPDGKKESVPLRHGDILRIDNKSSDQSGSQGVLIMFHATAARGKWTAYSLKRDASVLIGRDPRCDIVEPFAYVSAKHAKITCRDGHYFLTDCGSKAGTFVNGKRVTGEHCLREKDCIWICDSHYFFVDGRILYTKINRQREEEELSVILPHERPVILKADIDCKRVKSNTGFGMKELIRDIHLSIRKGTLVALLGTAGAGKSTVMNCLNGMDLEGVQGSVLYRNVDLLKHFDQMKYLIGSVPQKKTFHKYFTPEREFTYAARKRLPKDTSAKEIEERVDHTLKMLRIDGVRKNQNCKLSGGEQTRVNVGIELVADRDLLCLDEPDQGLSPNYKHELFEIMRSLAHQNGKSVLAIIHDVSEIHMFDQVIMLAKVDGVGRLAFSGSPNEAKKYFGVDIDKVYGLLEKDPKKYVRKLS